MSAPAPNPDRTTSMSPEDAQQFEELKTKFRAIFASHRAEIATLKEQFVGLEKKCHTMQASAAELMKGMPDLGIDRI